MQHFKMASRLIIAFATASSLVACDVTSVNQASFYDHKNLDLNFEKKPTRYPVLDIGSLLHLKTFTDHLSCIEMVTTYNVVIDNILKNYNDFFKSQNNKNHPEESDVWAASVLVCNNPNLVAYTTDQVIVIYSGLLELMEHAAMSYALYHGNELETALEQLTLMANSGSYDPNGVGVSVGSEVSDEIKIHAERLFTSALAFIILHEAGHIVLEHKDSNDHIHNDLAGVMEIQADYFAASALSSTGYSTTGIDLVFDILSRVNPDGSIYHPTPEYRIDIVERFQYPE